MTFSGLKTIENIVKNVKSVVANSINLSSLLASQSQRLPTRLVQRFRPKKDYLYITVDEVIEFNIKVTSEVGLLRDKSGLEGAITRPQMAAYYESADIATQTALLVEGIAMAHSFVDGNKRTALLACVTFLDVNGYKLKSTAHNVLSRQIEAIVITRNIESFKGWLRSNIRRL